MTRRGKAGPLGASLGKLVSGFGARGAGGYLQVQVAEAWATIAGPSVLSHTTGAHLRDGEMVVFVDSPVWATELSALSEEYRGRVNAELGKDRVRTVRFAVSKRVELERGFEEGASQEDADREADKVDSIPLTEAERAQVEASAAQIESEDLREAVVRATVADLEWKKGLAERKRR